MSAKDKLLKRRPKPLEIDGETYYVRPLTVREFQEAAVIIKDAARYMEYATFTVAKALTDENGAAVFADDKDPALADLPLDLTYRLAEEVASLSNTGKFQAIVKNSDATP